MDDVLEVIVIINSRQQGGTSEKSSLGFMECHVNIVNAMLLEETEDVLRGLEHNVAGGGVFLDSNPNSDATGNLSCMAICSRLLPIKVDKVNGGE